MACTDIKCCAPKYGTYQVFVRIIEARHLAQNVNSLVIVKVGHSKKKTMVRERTDCPYFNEYFVFDFTCNLDVLLSTRITISIYLRNCLRQLKFYGSIFFEVATVWDQPDHQYYHKWAMLTNPKDPAAGAKGYVKCNIGVHAKGEKLKIYPETDGEDDIEGNLLLPIGGTGVRQRARYIFTVYRADGLPTVNSIFRCQNYLENVNPYVQISFTGMKGSTSVAHEAFAPRYNEKIIFKEMFPPLCTRVRIAIKDRSSSHSSKVIATHILNLSKISNSGEYGFLPTYGPTFVHFYGKENAKRCSCTGKCTTALPAYRGRILLSLKTEFDNLEAPAGIGVEVEPAPPVIESSLWKTEEYLLVGILYDVCMIDRCRFTTKWISFEISLGNAGNRMFSYSTCIQNDSDGLAERVPLERCPDFVSQTVPRATATMDRKYDYLPLGSNKPCMHVKSWWPNLEWRILNSNSLSYIANYLDTELQRLEDLIAVESASAYGRYNDVICRLKQYCVNYLNMLDMEWYDEEGGITKLDRHRVNMCREGIEGILKMIKTNGDLPNNHYIKIAMIHCYKYLNKLRELCVDPQHDLPDIFIWMLAGSKRVAYARLPASQLLYAEEDATRGRKCGCRMNLFMKSPDDDSEVHDYSACNTEIFLWLGNAKFATACWSAIPPGYEVDYEANVDNFPRYVKYTEASKFQLRAHIFEGLFDPGMDTSGLLDPLIRVIFRGHTLSTKIIRQTLDPFWDQTLVFPPVYLYGTKEDMKTAPPNVTIEAFDQDLCGTLEFCGRCVAAPVMKLSTETYSPPDFPPKLTWYKFKTQKDSSGAVLAAFELIEKHIFILIGYKRRYASHFAVNGFHGCLPLDAVSVGNVAPVEGDHVGEGEVIDLPMKASSKSKIYNIPDDIRPKMVNHRLEVVFWGVRDMKKVNLIPVYKPRISIECGGVHLKSEVMENAKNFCNFEDTHLMVDLDMPEEDIYYPALTIKAYDSRGFGCFKFIGVCIIPTAYVFLEYLITEDEYESQIFDKKEVQKILTQKDRPSKVFPLPPDYDPLKEESTSLISYEKAARKDIFSKILKVAETFKNVFKRKEFRRKEIITYGNDDDEEHDWWSKYYASLQEEKSRELGITRTLVGRQRPVATLRMQPQFKGFQDKLTTFELTKGKKTGDPKHDEKNLCGKFKGHIAIYRWPHPEHVSCKTRTGRNAANGLFDDYPSHEAVNLLVRLYVVRAVNLHPSDPLTGKSDPYLTVRLGKKYINDQKHYIPNQLSPTFGKVFEIQASFPKDYLLTVQVWDYDATSADDFIGETKIDIENRFYSKHRAHCGIAGIYSTAGYNAWRDRESPTRILEFLCKKNNLPLPEYKKNGVTIGRKKFPFSAILNCANDADREECMALNVLRHWEEFPICGCALVPEHVERRPLFNPSRPGLEQGKLELWVDMFQVGELPPKPAVDITPKAPEDYELRVIIWNTEDVPLVDNQFLTGEKCSDIYVKGWIYYEDHQKTDVHYNSLTGEGNFNWRFIFRVTYSRAEHMMIVKKKVSVLARDATEQKIPCKLNLQVWDNDHFSPDDFLGALTIDLSKVPRGSANSKNCTLKLLSPEAPTFNLFKATRTKAWWPFTSTNANGRYIQAGKVQMEMIVLPAEKADEQPAGRGRDPPEELPFPNRPDTAFSWFRNPWKACRFVVCRYYKWRIICCCSSVLLVLLVACGIYAFPGYFVKRILGA